MSAKARARLVAQWLPVVLFLGFVTVSILDTDATAASKIPVVANVDGVPKRRATESIDALVRQVSSPVQWEAVVRRLALEGVTTYVEVGPGRVLGGLVKKIHKEGRVLSFSAPEELDEVVASAK